MGAENEKWQKMCQKFVGCSMLSDEFANEPHEPESFGGYVQNLLNQIESLRSVIKQLGEALKTIDDQRGFLLESMSDPQLHEAMDMVREALTNPIVKEIISESNENNY